MPIGSANVARNQAAVSVPVDAGTTGPNGQANTLLPLVAIADASGNQLGSAGASTSSGLPVKSATLSFLGFQQIVNATLAGSTALAVPAGATIAAIQNNGSQPVRFRLDGATTAPTASVGQRIAAGDSIPLAVGNAALTATRVIREADGATLDINYFN
jgi:hypothetical protein